jgi:hypothetical protein
VSGYVPEFPFLDTPSMIRFNNLSIENIDHEKATLRSNTGGSPPESDNTGKTAVDITDPNA